MNTTSILRHLGIVLLIACIGTSAVGCKTAYYAAMEKFGVEKRDLLKKRVVAARDEQKEAGEQFKDAMTRLKELTRFDGGQLEKAYGELKSEFDDCAARADAVRKRIRDMESVATDLFAEWENEIAQINTPALQATSKEQLRTTRLRYQELQAALKKAESSMGPVLTQFKDYTLALKHSLNAQAIASLKSEATNIQGDITRLVQQMNQSIAKADEFVKGLQ